MDIKSDQLQLKKILVDLEDEHIHLRASIGHLENEIKKREIEIQKLVSERELELAKEHPARKVPTTQTKTVISQKSHKEKKDPVISYSSEFAEQIVLIVWQADDRIYNDRPSNNIQLSMNIKYSRLDTGDSVNLEWMKWIKSHLPIAFLRRQVFLVSLDRDYGTTQVLSSDFKYGVVVDCGSSGSRAHIFRWKQNSVIKYIEHVKDKSSGKLLGIHINPGLSTFKDNPDEASEYMIPLMEYISQAIPRDKHAETPIYFLATAGLRLLDDHTQKRILSDINNDLPSRYEFPIRSQVISGSFEGVYSWLSVNMNKKLLNDSQDSKSYGMIEMGGASTQVTFELNPEIENEILKDLKDTEAIAAFRNEQVTVNLGSNRSIRLFATTFLGLGVNSAREAAIDLLVRDHLNYTSQYHLNNANLSKIEVRLKDPCLTAGSSEIVYRPTSLLQATHQSVGFVIKHQEDTFKVRLEGTGNFLNCMNLADRILHIVKKEKLNCEPSKPCPMALLSTKFIPYLHYQFIGLSEMFFTTNEMIKAAGRFNRSRVLHETQRICSTQYNRLLELYSNNGVSYEDRILYECFKASWLLTILNRSGFDMPANYERFNTVEQLDGHLIDWTMGAIFSEVGLKKVNNN